VIAAYVLGVAVGVVLGLLGAGGSILSVPILLYAAHVEARAAVIASLVIVGVTSSIAALQHAARRRVRLGTALLFSLSSLPASYLLARASRDLSSRATQLVFAAVMIASALGMLFRRERATPGRTRHLPLLVAGVAVGAITGLAGAGGGFLIVPALVLVGGVPMGEAVGTSLVSITLNCAAGLYGKWGAAPIDWRLVGVFTACAVGGSFVGLVLSKKISPDGLRRAFAFLVLAVALAMLGDVLLRGR
jgi:hypothetical protein